MIGRLANRRGERQDQGIEHGLAVGFRGPVETKSLNQDGAGAGLDNAAYDLGNFQQVRRGVLDHAGQGRLSLWAFKRAGVPGGGVPGSLVAGDEVGERLRGAEACGVQDRKEVHGGMQPYE